MPHLPHYAVYVDGHFLMACTNQETARLLARGFLGRAIVVDYKPELTKMTEEATENAEHAFILQLSISRNQRSGMFHATISHDGSSYIRSEATPQAAVLTALHDISVWSRLLCGLETEEFIAWNEAVQMDWNRDRLLPGEQDAWAPAGQGRDEDEQRHACLKRRLLLVAKAMGVEKASDLLAAEVASQ